MSVSALQNARASYVPKMPEVLLGNICIEQGAATESVSDREEIKRLFPNTYGMPIVKFVKSDEKTFADKPVNVGVILSGGQAPGGHNVIAGVFDGIKKLHKDSRLYGFILGPSGLVNHKYKEITKDIIDEYRNTGGFDIIGSGRTKLDTKEQFDKGLAILKKLKIQALVIIGGDDSNTNACMLAEYYKSIGADIQVIGVPKTIDGDLKNSQIETSFGFDSACKVYSELIGNVQRDCYSAQKYWHFIKVMGRSASHIALECALQTQPNICIISEEVEAKGRTLDDIIDYIAGIVAKRAVHGMNFGTVIIPEGLIEFIPRMKRLIKELNIFLANIDNISLIRGGQMREYITSKLSPKNSEFYSSLPDNVADQLVLDRDPHGNVLVSMIQTEELLAQMVSRRLAHWAKDGKYEGKFASITHFFGYEGRCVAPSNFDANYSYSLGYTSAMLAAAGKTGYMASIKNTVAHPSKWIAGGVPITMMMNMEKRKGNIVPVIQKSYVDMKGKPYLELEKHRKEWASGNHYVYPGPMQYFGPSEVCDVTTITLQLENC